MVEEARIARIESKIDSIVESMTKISAHEERIVTLFRNQENMSTKMSTLEQDLKTVRDKVLVGSTYGNIFSRLMWLIAGALIGIAGKLISLGG